MYEYRPEIDMPKTMLQKIMNIIGYTLFIASVVVSLISLPGLPDSVPIHFNLAGQADNWGSKYFLLLLPIIGMISFLPMEALEKRPHMHNYPSTINESNVKQYYAISIRTMNMVKNGMLGVFALLQVEILLAASESSFSFGPSLIVILIVLATAPIVWHIMSIREVNKAIETK